LTARYLDPANVVDRARRIQIGNWQSEIGNEVTLPPLASNDLFDGGFGALVFSDD